MKLPEIDVCADDAEAIAAILDGDVNAYSTLVLRYQGAIFNLMYRMSGSYEDAADLAQETFIKAYDQLYRFQKASAFSGSNRIDFPQRNFRPESKVAHVG